MDLEALKVMYQNHPLVSVLIAEIERLQQEIQIHKDDKARLQELLFRVEDGSREP